MVTMPDVMKLATCDPAEYIPPEYRPFLTPHGRRRRHRPAHSYVHLQTQRLDSFRHLPTQPLDKVPPPAAVHLPFPRTISAAHWRACTILPQAYDLTS